MDSEASFCAGYLRGGPSVCKGDSGGPMIAILSENLDDQSAHYQVGGSQAGPASELYAPCTAEALLRLAPSAPRRALYAMRLSPAS